MFRYYQLNYTLILNRILACIASFLPRTTEKKVSEVKKKVIVRCLPIMYTVGKFIVGKFCFYSIIIPIIISILGRGLKVDAGYNSVIYYYMIIGCSIAARVGKSKIMAAEEVDYIFLKIYKYSPSKYMLMKKKKMLLEMLAELLLLTTILYSMKYEWPEILTVIGLIFVCNIFMSCLFLEFVCVLKEKYAKLKYALVIGSNLIIPFLTFYIVSISDLSISVLNIRECLVLLAGSILGVISLFRDKNAKLLCRIIIIQYYNDNALLESIDQEEATKEKKTHYKQRKGEKYLNYIFFLRHKRIILRDCIIKCIIAVSVIILGIKTDIVFSNEQWNLGITILPIILYYFSESEKVCNMFWNNCDINLFKHTIFKQKKFIRTLSIRRLYSLLAINNIMAVICLGVFLSASLVLKKELWNEYFIFLAIVMQVILNMHAVINWGEYCLKLCFNKKTMAIKCLSYIIRAMYFTLLGTIMLLLSNMCLR